MDISVLQGPLQNAQMSAAGLRAVDLRGCDRVVEALVALNEGGA